MSKWADYCIIAVKYGPNRNAITRVKALQDNGAQLGSTHYFDRVDVVTAILRGTTFVTAYIRDSKYTRGEDVRVVKIGDDRYLRTDQNSVRADNLGNLPEYA